MHVCYSNALSIPNKKNEYLSTKQDNRHYFPMVLLSKFNASIFTFSATKIKNYKLSKKINNE